MFSSTISEIVESLSSFNEDNFNRFFPGITIEELLDINYLYPLSVSFLLLTYIIYGVYKWRSAHK